MFNQPQPANGPADAAPPHPAPAPIRTPDQRLRVFVSSTLQELAPERVAARTAIAHLRLSPVLFELGARPHPPRDLYRAYLAQSDVFLGIYWQRYGWVAPGMAISGLEDEYLLAAGKPKLIYVKTPAPEREAGLRGLLQGIQSDDTVSYKPFTTAEELGELIENDLALLLTESFAMQQMPQAPPANARPHNNLPVLRTPLIDRAEERGLLHRLLVSPDVALVTLTGPGGTGKTRLALAVAGELDGHFGDGIFFVGLETVADPALVLPSVAAVLGVRESPERPLLEALKSALAERHALLVPDNFEHLAAAAPQVAELLEACSRLTVLVTSRQPLHLREEHEVPVPPLGVPDEDTPLQQLLRRPAVALFVSRAQDVRPEFRLTAENAAAVAAICRRLDGLPLALELAAARVRMLSPQALLDRLEARLPVLTGGPRDLPARQQTMHATIEWSYDLLTAPEQTAFCRFGVFAGGWSLEAAEAICNPAGDLGPDILDVVGALVDKSLVRTLAAGDGLPRFSMLQTVQEFAVQRLGGASEADLARQRHADYFLRFVTQNTDQTMTPANLAGMEVLDPEQDNIRAALAYAEQAPGAWETGARLAAALTNFWYLRGQLREGRDWAARFLGRPEGAEPTALRADLLLTAGMLAWTQGDFGAAAQYLAESVDLFRALGDKQRLSRALAHHGSALLGQHNPAAAAPLFAESLALVRQIGEQWSEGFVLTQQSLGLLQAGDAVAARAPAEAARALWAARGDDWGHAFGGFILGAIAGAEGNYGEARRLTAESAGCLRQVGDRWGLSQALLGLVDALLHEEAYREVPPLLEEQLTLSRALGAESALRVALAQVAVLAAAQGQAADAARLFGGLPDLQAQVAFAFGARGLFYLEHLAAVRAQLDEATWNQAWAEGAARRPDEALAEARAVLSGYGEVAAGPSTA